MKEWRVRWQSRPHNQNAMCVLFVQAETALDACSLVRDHVERKFGFDRETFTVHNATEVDTRPQGKIVQP